MRYTGRMLLYFNRHADAPRVWCLSTPDRAWEIQVQSVTLRCVHVATKYDSAIKPQPNGDGPPSAYLELFGTVTVDVDGRAVVE